MTLKNKILNKNNTNFIKPTMITGKSIFKLLRNTLAPSLAFLSADDFLKWAESITKSASTIYDKALDSEYFKTHIGGANHRLFDGGHDIFSAWNKVKDASSTDSFTQEVMGYASALWKDGTTIKGLPFFSITDKANYDEWAEKITQWIPGVDKKYLYDLLSFDAGEILGTTIGIIGIFLNFKKQDKEKFSEILGSMGIISLIHANPIMGVCCIVTIAWAFYKKKNLNKKGLIKGGVLSSISMLMFSTLGLPLLIELVFVIVLSNLLRKHLFDQQELFQIIKQNLNFYKNNTLYFSKNLLKANEGVSQ